MKKAQMEMVGLLLIVVIIAVVFLFIVSFNLREAEQQVNVVDEFLDETIPSNFAPVLMESSTDCTDANNKYLQLKELLNICIRQPDFSCGTEPVCEYMNNTIQEVADKSLGRLGYRYNIIIENILTPSNTQIITNIENDCDITQDYTTRTLNIPTSHGRARMLLRICGLS